LVSVSTGEGVLTVIWHTYSIIERYTPSVVPAMRAARQQHGELHFEALNAVQVPLALGAMAALPVLVWLGLRRRAFVDLALLAATVSLAILGNAVVCGTLSNAHDRYRARLAWGPLFAPVRAALPRRGAEPPIPAPGPLPGPPPSAAAPRLPQFPPTRPPVPPHDHPPR